MQTTKMSSSTEARRRMQRLRSRGSVAPPACYDPCNNTFLAAQAVGTTPELCNADSMFRTYYNACSDCVHSYLDDSEATDYLGSVFGQFTGYCDETGPWPEALSTANSPPVMAVSIISVQTATETVTFIPPLPSLQDTTIIVITATQDGHPTVLTYTKSFTHLPTEFPISTSENISSSVVQQDTSKATAQMPEETDLSPPSMRTGNNAQKSQAWVAGPVIGAVTGVAILLLATWLLFRLRKKKKSDRKLHEVNDQSAPKSELESKIPPQELAVQGHERQPVELPGSSPYNRLEYPTGYA